jgi:hypothetical protein
MTERFENNSEIKKLWGKAQVFNRNIRSENPKNVKIGINALGDMIAAAERDNDLLAVMLNFVDPVERSRFKSWIAERRGGKIDAHIQRVAPQYFREYQDLRNRAKDLILNYKENTTEEERREAAKRKKAEQRKDCCNDCCNCCTGCCDAACSNPFLCASCDAEVCFAIICCPCNLLGALS